MTSPYASFADTLRDNGYHVMPAMPGKKVPGSWAGTEWRPASQWQKWCDTIPPDFMHQRWQDWPDAGICVAHGAIVGLDIDTDRRDVGDAASAAVGPSPVRRTGAKGWMGYYRPGAGLGAHAARLRWYDGDGKICVELLLHGTQSVIPPTIHPDTGKPYKWITPDNFESVPADELPELPSDAIERLDRAFAALGLTRQAPRKARATEYDRPEPSANDLEKPIGRSINDRAMEPAAIDRWWPALQLPKSRQRGASGSWEAVPFWRGSASGRGLSDRNPNLKCVPSGIIDFGADRSYTAIDVVMAARDCSFAAAVDWLEQYIRAEEIVDMSGITAPAAVVEPETVEEKNFAPTEPEAKTPRIIGKFIDRGQGLRKPVKKTLPTTNEEFDAEFPLDVPPFPVRDFSRDLTGLLRDLTIHIDAASRMRSEQGAFGAALSLMSVLFGRRVTLSETDLRTNLYVVGTATSGAGKSSAMNAMKKAAFEFGISDRIGGSDFTSDAAILNELSASHHPLLFCVDEFGDIMRRILGAKSASHEQGISRVLKDIYSSAATTYHGKSYASKSRTDLIEPHLSIYGISTYESFWQGINGESFKDGLIARFIVIPIGATEVQRPSVQRFDEVAHAIRDICSSAAPGNMGTSGLVSVSVSHDLYARYEREWETNQRHAERANLREIHGAASIIMRVSENAMKIAMISAAGRDHRNPVMTEDDYELGYAVAQWSAISMISAIQTYYFESTAHKNAKTILAMIEAEGRGGLAKTDLTNRTQAMGKLGRDEAISTLREGGRIVEDRRVPVGKGGPPRFIYISRKFLRQTEDQDE